MKNNGSHLPGSATGAMRERARLTRTVKRKAAPTYIRSVQTTSSFLDTQWARKSRFGFGPLYLSAEEEEEEEEEEEGDERFKVGKRVWKAGREKERNGE
ncbi:uncharacterized protein DS421_12g384290 [Arachis hypogaea]|nr:uncharacterized protein DS421_12g384290 [Arachis hypogaea]